MCYIWPHNQELAAPMPEDHLHAEWRELRMALTTGSVVEAVYGTADKLLRMRKLTAQQVPSGATAKSAPGAASWLEVINDPVFTSLRDLLRQDPFARRCVDKPRGYAGDATLLDMAYRLLTPDDGPALGRKVFTATTNSPGSRSIRERRQRLAGFVDSVAATSPRATIASLACGHLRELQLCRALSRHGIARLHAIDQDERSLEEVRQAYGDTCIETHRISLQRLLIKGAEIRVDGYYAAGLFDYLDDDTARATISSMLSCLNLGGRVLIANLTPRLIDIAYMEAVMDWWLIYRTPEALRSIAESAAGSQNGTWTTYEDTLGNVAYAEFIRQA